MGGPRRLPRQAHAVQHPRQGRQPIRRRPALLDVRGDVEQAVAADPVRLRVRPGQHPRPQFLLLGQAQLLRPPRPRAVVQPRQALGIVAQHCVPQRLALPPHDPSRIRPARSLQCLRDRECRRAARRSASPWANRRSSAAPMSSRITKPRAPTNPSSAEQTGRQPHFSRAASHIKVRSKGNWYNL